MRLFFLVKTIEIAVAILLAYLVLRTTKLCGPGGGKRTISPEQCPLLFDAHPALNDEQAVARFFENLYPEAANSSTLHENSGRIAKRASGDVLAEILNSTDVADRNGTAEDVTLEASGGIIEYVVLKIQHAYGECLTCCDIGFQIGLHNMMCLPNQFSPSLTCHSLSPVLIPVLLWLFTMAFNVAYMVKIFSSLLPPGRTVDIARSLVICGVWFLSASLLSYVHFSWTDSWTSLPYSPYFPPRWIVAEVICWLVALTSLLQLWFHKKLFFTVRLTEPPRTFDQLGQGTEAKAPLMQSSRVFLFDSAESVEANPIRGVIVS